MKTSNAFKLLNTHYCQDPSRSEGIAKVIGMMASDRRKPESEGEEASMAAARILGACSLTKVFSMLCARPCGGIASLRVMLVPGCGIPVTDLLPPRGPCTLQRVDPAKFGFILDLQAEFGRLLTESDVHFEGYHDEDRAEMIDRWLDTHTDRFVPERILAASPHPLTMKVLTVFPKDECATLPDDAKSYTGPLAVLRNKRTGRQWLDRFERDLWFENDHEPVIRLKDEYDHRAWFRAVGDD